MSCVCFYITLFFCIILWGVFWERNQFSLTCCSYQQRMTYVDEIVSKHKTSTTFEVWFYYFGLLVVVLILFNTQLLFTFICRISWNSKSDPVGQLIQCSDQQLIVCVWFFFMSGQDATWFWYRGLIFLWSLQNAECLLSSSFFCTKMSWEINHHPDFFLPWRVWTLFWFNSFPFVGNSLGNWTFKSPVRTIIFESKLFFLKY